MGKQKYSMHGGLHGRNMLILEYIWIAYCMSLGPGEAPDPAFRRGRKQISSHIQVLKAFYKHSKYCKFTWLLTGWHPDWRPSRANKSIV